ncbi:MAG: iron-containing alcohol dehydrogenase family protein [Lautropia sp.]
MAGDTGSADDVGDLGQPVEDQGAGREPMKSFRHVIPSLRIYQGTDSLDMLGPELDRLGCRRAVIFVGKTLASAGSVLDVVRAAIGDRLAGTCSGVEADTPLPAVESAILELERLRADAIIPVGGGSAMTFARAVNILHAEKGDARQLCTARDPATGRLNSPRLPARKLPVIALPTTPTTATVKAGSAIHDTAQQRRLVLFDPKARAGAVLLHPALLQSAPRGLIVGAALNTLALALEGLMARHGDPLADAMLIHATRLLVKRLPEVRDSDDLDIRADLMAASILTGHGSDYAGAGMAIAIGHAIATRFRIETGVSNAIMLPHAVCFNSGAARAGLEKIASAVGVGTAGIPAEAAVLQMLDTLFGSLGLPRCLRDVGVSRDSLAGLAAMSFDDWFLQGNPRPVRDCAELERVLEEAW